MGFCQGVEHAIETAEQALSQRGGEISSLGEIIHNRQVVERLAEKGLRVVADPEHASGTVLIRSHGEPPGVFETLAQRGVDIVDATCVLVKRAQRVVKALDEEGYQVVIVGQESHPEVRAICGYASNVICVDSPDQLDRLKPGGKLGIICQTTHSPEYFAEMIGRIMSRGFREIKIVNTLCGEVKARQEAAVELAREVDVMFVLGGKQSANTRELARLCAQQGVATYHLENWRDFKPEMVAGKRLAGLTAGASTPRWIIEEFLANLAEFTPKTV
jgi:4-hydroxy-3-methylbut-2-enyl diphosphate reductase